MSWTDERVEKLKELWAEGMSASQIAKQLGGVTRNAVIGKVHRLGLSNRVVGQAQPVAAEEAPRAAPGPKPAEAEARTAKKPAPDPAPPADAAGASGPEAAEAPEALPGVAADSARREPVIRDATQPRPPGPPTPEEESARETLAEIEKMAKKLDLLELTERTCKWPIGDPTDEDFHFCGLPSVTGKPYCEHHVQVAFQPMSTRRDRNRAVRWQER